MPMRGLVPSAPGGGSGGAGHKGAGGHRAAPARAGPVRGAVAGRAERGGEPQGAGGAQVGAVEVGADAEGRGEAAGAAGEVERAGGAAVAGHEVGPLERLEGAQEDALADALGPARDVEHPGQAVGQVDVGVAALEEQGAVAPRGTAVGVARRVVPQVGLGLDDPAGEAAVRQLADQDGADQEAGEGGGVLRKVGAGERHHEPVGRWTYIDWMPTRPGPVKRLVTSRMPPSRPVRRRWTLVVIRTEGSL